MFNGGGVAPVEIGRGGWVGELRGPTVKLSRGSARAEELRRGGFDGEVELPGFERTAALF